MLASTGGATHIVDGVTVVDCQKQVRSWRLLRSVLWFLIPSCSQGRNYMETSSDGSRNSYSDKQLETRQRRHYYNNDSYRYYLQRQLSNLVRSDITTETPTNSTMTGTIFGYRRGKVNLCIQSNPNSSIPILLLELAIPTSILAKEMKNGLLRLSLECNSYTRKRSSNSLLSVPVWTMYCNGRKVGFAIKRVPTQVDKKVLKLMQSVVVGVGTISGKTLITSADDHEDYNRNRNHNHGDLMYLRANFKRVSGSSDSESFHLINPDGSNGQELSIFFLRSS